MAESQMVTLTVSVAVASVTRMEGEKYQDYVDRCADQAARYVKQSLSDDNRIKVLQVRGAR